MVDIKKFVFHVHTCVFPVWQSIGLTFLKNIYSTFTQYGILKKHSLPDFLPLLGRGECGSSKGIASDTS